MTPEIKVFLAQIQRLQSDLGWEKHEKDKRGESTDGYLCELKLLWLATRAYRNDRYSHLSDNEKLLTREVLLRQFPSLIWIHNPQLPT
jgi:hypothetical protein